MDNKILQNLITYVFYPPYIRNEKRPGEINHLENEGQDINYNYRSLRSFVKCEISEGERRDEKLLEANADLVEDPLVVSDHLQKILPLGFWNRFCVIVFNLLGMEDKVVKIISEVAGKYFDLIPHRANLRKRGEYIDHVYKTRMGFYTRLMFPVTNFSEAREHEKTALKLRDLYKQYEMFYVWVKKGDVIIDTQKERSQKSPPAGILEGALSVEDLKGHFHF